MPCPQSSDMRHMQYYDFIICIDFTHIAASNTATDDVTN